MRYSVVTPTSHSVQRQGRSQVADTHPAAETTAPVVQRPEEAANLKIRSHLMDAIKAYIDHDTASRRRRRLNGSVVCSWTISSPGRHTNCSWPYLLWQAMR